MLLNHMHKKVVEIRSDEIQEVLRENGVCAQYRNSEALNVQLSLGLPDSEHTSKA